MHKDQPRVLFLGCGDLGTGAAHALYRAGFQVAIAELERPLAVRRRAAFSQAARDGQVAVQGVWCRRIGLEDLDAGPDWKRGVWLLTVPWGEVLASLAPGVLVDARLAKQPLVPRPPRSIFHVALGPGHTAGRDCDVAVETLRGPRLGHVIHSGSAAADTGVPGEVGGETSRRVLRAPHDGVLHVDAPIGTRVRRGDRLARVGETAVCSSLDGVVRGMLADGDRVVVGQKLGDVDPRASAPGVERISDKAGAVGRGVLRAVCERFDLVLPEPDAPSSRHDQ